MRDFIHSINYFEHQPNEGNHFLHHMHIKYTPAHALGAPLFHFKPMLNAIYRIITNSHPYLPSSFNRSRGPASFARDCCTWSEGVAMAV